MALYLQSPGLLNQRQVYVAFKPQGACPGTALSGLGEAVRMYPGAPTAEDSSRVGGDDLPHGHDVSQGRIGVGFLPGPATDAGAYHLSRRIPGL